MLCWRLRKKSYPGSLLFSTIWSFQTEICEVCCVDFFGQIIANLLYFFMLKEKQSRCYLIISVYFQFILKCVLDIHTYFHVPCL